MADLMRKITGVSRDNNGSKVVGIQIKLGALAHISPEHFMEHFKDAAKGTVAEDARVDIEVGTETTDPHAQDIRLQSLELEDQSNPTTEHDAG